MEEDVLWTWQQADVSARVVRLNTLDAQVVVRRGDVIVADITMPLTNGASKSIALEDVIAWQLEAEKQV